MTKDLIVGVKLIDDEHKELIDRINAVLDMGTKSFSDAETKKTVDMLGDYIHKHFSDEEELQRKCGYPKHEWHKGQHKIYIGEFDKLKHEFEKNGASPAFSLALNNSIVGWILRHIKTVDVELGKFYRGEIKL
jgi:hemerythrin